LLVAMEALGLRLADAVQRRRALGLPVTIAASKSVVDIDRLLAVIMRPDGVRTPAALYQRCAEGSPLDQLVERFGLSTADADAWLVAAAPELDHRLELAMRALNGEPVARRPTVGLVLELTGRSRWDDEDRARLDERGKLARLGLWHTDDDSRPALARTLAVSARVVAHVLGGSEPDPMIAGLITPLEAAPIAGSEALAAALRGGVETVWVHQARGRAGGSMAAMALASAGSTPFALDLARLPAEDTLGDVLVAALREATLLGKGLVLLNVDPARDVIDHRVLRDVRTPVVFVSESPASAADFDGEIVLVEAGVAGIDVRDRFWSRVITRTRATLDERERDALVRSFRLTPEQITQAGELAAAAAIGRDRRPDLRDLAAAARTFNDRRLEQLVRRIEPAATLGDLVVPDATIELLRDVIGRVRHREVVLADWGLGPNGRRQGVTCLMAGPSGTGKTLSAEAVAGELGVDLYTIDLSQVVDKYVGETEKNLERIFTSAEGVNAVLFFDEADALFGKRSAVRDSHDRHANVEVAYLLQRMEMFDGVAMLASNLHANLDDAFSRRLDVIIRYSMPGPSERRALWQRHLPPTLPLTDDVDLDLLADAVEASGGVIANICRSAAFRAADDEGVVTMGHLVQAAYRELAKQGRLQDPARFGRWASVVESG
jgi:hypothetical protein